MRRYHRIIFAIALAMCISAVAFIPFGGDVGIMHRVEIPDLASSGASLFYGYAIGQIGVVNSYDFTNGYYGNGGYPPKDTGVCSDVLWRAFSGKGDDLKGMVDEDMRLNPKDYPAFFDSNINFRRVKNLNVFLKKKSEILTNEMIPWDFENLKSWQKGDIVVFDELAPKNLWHIGIISDKRRTDGVPYMLDNHGYGVSMRITPLDWPANIIGHYRYYR